MSVLVIADVDLVLPVPRRRVEDLFGIQAERARARTFDRSPLGWCSHPAARFVAADIDSVRGDSAARVSQPETATAVAP